MLRQLLGHQQHLLLARRRIRSILICRLHAAPVLLGGRVAGCIQICSVAACLLFVVFRDLLLQLRYELLLGGHDLVLLLLYDFGIGPAARGRVELLLLDWRALALRTVRFLLVHEVTNIRSFWRAADLQLLMTSRRMGQVSILLAVGVTIRLPHIQVDELALCIVLVVQHGASFRSRCVVCIWGCVVLALHAFGLLTPLLEALDVLDFALEKVDAFVCVHLSGGVPWLKLEGVPLRRCNRDAAGAHAVSFLCRPSTQRLLEGPARITGSPRLHIMVVRGLELLHQIRGSRGYPVQLARQAVLRRLLLLIRMAAHTVRSAHSNLDF